MQKVQRSFIRVYTHGSAPSAILGSFWTQAEKLAHQEREVIGRETRTAGIELVVLVHTR